MSMEKYPSVLRYFISNGCAKAIGNWQYKIWYPNVLSSVDGDGNLSTLLWTDKGFHTLHGLICYSTVVFSELITVN